MNAATLLVEKGKHAKCFLMQLHRLGSTGTVGLWETG